MLLTMWCRSHRFSNKFLACLIWKRSNSRIYGLKPYFHIDVLDLYWRSDEWWEIFLSVSALVRLEVLILLTHSLLEISWLLSDVGFLCLNPTLFDMSWSAWASGAEGPFSVLYDVPKHSIAINIELNKLRKVQNY